MADSGKNADETLHRVLAGGGLSGGQREQILDRVLGAPEVRQRRRWVNWLAMGLVPAAAVAAIALLVVHRIPDSHVTAKGTAVTLFLQARCPNRAPGRCRRGDRLVFEVSGAANDVLFAAYAERPSGERVWYFPTVDGRLPEVSPRQSHGVVGEGIRIGDEHVPGPYALHLFVLDPLADRSGLRAALISGRAASRAAAVIPMEVEP